MGMDLQPHVLIQVQYVKIGLSAGKRDVLKCSC